MNHSLDERQEFLKCLYEFDCICVACQNDYPTLQNYPSNISVPYGEYLYLESIWNFDRGQLDEQNIKKELKKAADILVKYGDKYPCLLHRTENILNQILDCLVNSYPFYKALKKM